MKGNTRLQYTIFNTPVVRTIFRAISVTLMKLLGWKKSGALPDIGKFVIIVAPHTSNWDFFYGMITAFAFRLDIYYLAKSQLFRPPFGPLMRWLGGIRVERSVSHHTVDQTIAMFNENERLVIAIAPEGTRAKVKNWKTGFYHIAMGAGVPIQTGFIDYAKKSAGAGLLIRPTGDMEADMEAIRRFYAGIQGRYGENTAPAGPAGRE